MWGGKSGLLLALMLAALVVAGCSGALYESKYEDGREGRLKVDQAESWSVYDEKPRDPASRAKKDQDAMGIILKGESTF